MTENNGTYQRIERLKKEISSDQIRASARLKGDECAWTRDRQMPLPDMIRCTMAKKGKTPVIELDDYFEDAGRMEQMVSKQDYLQQRKKLNPEVFRQLNQSYLRDFYCGQEVKCWNGYIVLAIDGSAAEVPNSAENRKEYGVSENGNGGVARANCSVMYDVFNKFMLDIVIDSYPGNEIGEAKTLISSLREIIGSRPVLIIFDRGYVSLEFQDYLDALGIKYLIRLKSDAFKAEVNGMVSEDEEIFLEYTKNRLYNVKQRSLERWRDLSQRRGSTIRMVRTSFQDEKQGILITNFREACMKDIRWLYRKRWMIEEQYNTMKNKMKFESVTGNASIYVKQDFFAQTLVSNIIQDLIIRAEYQAVSKPRKKPLCHPIRINHNVAIGQFKKQFIRLMLEEDEACKTAMFWELIAKMERNILPIRELKSSPRKFNNANKTQCNLKDSI